MSSSFLQLAVESCDLSQAENETIFCWENSQNGNLFHSKCQLSSPGTFLSCHCVNLLSFANSYFSLSKRWVTWSNSQLKNIRRHIDHPIQYSTMSRYQIKVPRKLQVPTFTFWVVHLLHGAVLNISFFKALTSKNCQTFVGGQTKWYLFHRVSDSRPDYYCKYQLFPKRSHWINIKFPCISSLKILWCATVWDMLLFPTIQ